MAGVMTASTLIAAKTSVGTAASRSGGNQDILQDFAQDMEDVLSEPGYMLTVATGADRYNPAAGASTLWVMRQENSDSGQGIGYHVNDAGQPELFAPQPISNQLMTRDVQVYSYAKLTDFDPTTNSFTTPERTDSCSGVDVDAWLCTFFNVFDTLFSPELSSSMLVIDAKATNKPAGVSSYLKSFADQKEILATVASDLMGPVYASQTNTRQESARETFRQTLLVKLSNLYTVRAAVSFGATVVANIAQDANEQAPQLFGNLTWNVDDPALESLITLTSPKMPLVKGDNQPVTFLLESPGNIKINGVVLQEVRLDLSYTGMAIEHQIGEIAGIEGYMASSWLSPITTEAGALLTSNLGSFSVPLILRAFPSTPRMNTQTGVQTNKVTTDLNQLTQWTYSYTYSLDFHFEQDRIYNEVLFNIHDSGTRMRAGYLDAFQGLAQFINSQDAVTRLISETVPQIDALTSDQATINNASLALGAFLKMASDIASQASNAGGLKMYPHWGGLSQGEACHFTISESTQTVKHGGTDSGVWVVALNFTDGVPAGMTGAPQVQIAGYTATALPVATTSEKVSYSYYYLDCDGQPLTAEQAQSIAPRTVVLPGMQILSRQDAISIVHLTRNEDIGGVINSPFVYTTPNVSFGNPLHPTVRSRQTFNIATLGMEGGQPVSRSLDAHMEALFNALFAQSLSGNSTLQINVTYFYTLADALTEMAVPLPVLVMPPMTISVDGSDLSVPSLSQMESQLSDAVIDWAQAYQPSARGAQLVFDVTFMSNLTDNPMPLLDLAGLELPVEFISPPLPVNQ
ncbi:hypothetical protein ABC733_19590 [Mangrovibacter sp. SLW1]